MDRVWLRDYEKMLSSNRRSVDVRPKSADISNNRVKKGRPAKVKKRKDNFTSEVDVARQLLMVGTDIDDYDRNSVEKQERILFQRKFESKQQLKTSKNQVQVSFKKLTTFDEFSAVETRRDQCFATGDREIFRSLYPDIDHQLSPVQKKAAGAQRPKSSPMVRSQNKPVPFQLTAMIEDELNSRPERPPAHFEISVVKQALELWKKALGSLRLRGKEIVYEDVSNFSKHWKRSETLRPMVVYISILLGLQSGDPSVTQRSVFRELYTLLKFFREANPLTLPKRRVIKANTFYLNTIAQSQERAMMNTTDANSFQLNILGWIQALQTIFSIILDAKKRHEIMNANFDEELCQMEEAYAMEDPASTPFKHLQQQKQKQKQKKGPGSAETPKQHHHRLAKLSPTGTWSTRLTSPSQMAAAAATAAALEGLSLGEGLSAFDSTAAQSFLDVSHSLVLPLDDLSLEYSPDKSLPDCPPPLSPRLSSSLSPATIYTSSLLPQGEGEAHHRNADPYENFVEHYSNQNTCSGVTSP